MTWNHTPPPRLITADRWLAETFPHRDRLRADVAERLAHRTPISVSRPGKAYFGQAFVSPATSMGPP